MATMRQFFSSSGKGVKKSTISVVLETRPSCLNLGGSNEHTIILSASTEDPPEDPVEIAAIIGVPCFSEDKRAFRIWIEFPYLSSEPIEV
eukprot:CAMPEP_0197839354 /NCGR_PEP_ID=MMETSP1437-20131217/42308_1 /TAXON_ID=49252 ORGANISM="Eucampia antarctica, Strain CCMP1452" /NCGR_SAMPLE_ID=MMETSP1437 /ASSEMBLY_ACC=CAM_ASM_001096 /LENGTH=89 /DNA_ID=CAMNT_0043448309 /DNA_START=58 /DNA_END=327 /DNA_ORIENTATION=+